LEKLPIERETERVLLTVLDQYQPKPMPSILPPIIERLPPMGNLSGDAKAPELLSLTQLKRSESNSAFVGNRYPIGQGLFKPFTPCHKLLFWGLRQSQGEFSVTININK
jgi:hypothetical protein